MPFVRRSIKHKEKKRSAVNRHSFSVCSYKLSLWNFWSPETERLNLLFWQLCLILQTLVTALGMEKKNIIKGDNGQSDTSFTVWFVYIWKQTVCLGNTHFQELQHVLASAKIMGGFLFLGMWCFCRSSKNKVKILFALTRWEPVQTVDEPDVSSGRRCSFSNLQPPVASPSGVQEALSFIGLVLDTAVQETQLLFIWSWCLRIFLIYLFFQMRKGGCGWAGVEDLVLYLLFLFHLPEFSQGTVTVSSLKMKECRMMFSFFNFFF